jgi:hypothetical protein
MNIPQETYSLSADPGGDAPRQQLTDQALARIVVVYSVTGKKQIVDRVPGQLAVVFERSKQVGERRALLLSDVAPHGCGHRPGGGRLTAVPTTAADTDDDVGLAEFRDEVRTWLRENQPDEPPPLDPGAVDAEATVLARLSPTRLAKFPQSLCESRLATYQAAVAVPAAAAAARTPAKRSAQRFSTPSATA